MKDSDTIYALSSGGGCSAIAVIRISGDCAFDALRLLQGSLQAPGILAMRILRRSGGREVLDRAMTVRFASPRSYTGEDMAEIHCHGSRAIIAAIIEEWRMHRGLRLRAALAGEFTRRALLAGKMDLTRAEGLIDLIEAETQAQRRQALAQSEGVLEKIYNDWSERLFALLCEREAQIDFPDEDLEEDGLDGLANERSPQRIVSSRMAEQITGLREEISAHLELADTAERIRSGVAVALIGAPNVGKSSLLNRIACDTVAIVSARAGTTRDVVRVRVELGGLAVDLLDTAGLRKPRSAVEAEGIRRAEDSARSKANIVVCICDARKPDMDALSIDGKTRAYDFLLLNKSDLLSVAARKRISDTTNANGSLKDSLKGNHLPTFLLSARSGDGVGDFMEALKDKLQVSEQPIAPTRARHREALTDVCESLLRAQSEKDWALQAQGLRDALEAMERLTGVRDIDALLDKIFSDFCIGK